MTDAHGDDAEGIWARTTAPQSRYGMREVWTGVAVLVIGLLLTFGLAIALT